MKAFFFYIFGAILLSGCMGSGEHKEADRTAYQLIGKRDTIPGSVNMEAVNKLAEPLKAMAAFYAAMGGSNCDGVNCELTTALGLGDQGSDAHKALISKYFPGDAVAAAVVKQDCYLRPNTASTFSDFEYLTIAEHGDTVRVEYNLMYYDHGEVTNTGGPDSYLFQDGTFKKVERQLWAHLE